MTDMAPSFARKCIAIPSGLRYGRSMTMATFALQPVMPADSAALRGFARAFHAEDGHALDEAGERGVAQAAAGDPAVRAWFIVEDGTRIGYAVLTLGFSILHGGRDGFIDDLYLVPAA